MTTSLQRMADVRAFAAVARPWLLRDEIENNLMLSIVQGIVTSAIVCADAYFAVIRSGGDIVGCALRTPPHKLLLTRVPDEAIPFLAHDMTSVYQSLPAVLGPDATARAFAGAWASLTGATFTAGMNQRLYVLDRITRPNPIPPGHLRAATARDQGVATLWLQAFVDEAAAFPIQPHAEARRLIREGRLAFWEHQAPVSMAAVSGSTDHGARIGWVYTPPEHRRRGYAGACVAELSQHQFDAGKRYCVLYTDLANPTSNQIYQRLGYRPVSDVRDYEFSGPRDAG